jgi:hypothetical protein
MTQGGHRLSNAARETSGARGSVLTLGCDEKPSCAKRLNLLLVYGGVEHALEAAQ